MAKDEPERSQGVNMEDIDAILDDIAFPVTAAELRDRHGDRSIGRTNANPIIVRELVEPLDDDETVKSREDLRQTFMSLMPTESVGREGYSDRGGAQPKETPEANRVDPDESL